MARGMAAAFLLQAALSMPVFGAGSTAAPMVVATGGDVLSVSMASQQRNRFAAVMRQQYDFSCGSAAVASLLSYDYGSPMTEQAAFDMMFASGDAEQIRREGFSMLDMKRLLKVRGFEADGFELPLDKLAEAHVPAIVLIVEGGYHHFVVVKGLREGRVLLGDPSRGLRVVSRETFERSWQNRLLFVIHSHQETATFNSPIDWNAAPAAPLALGVARESLSDLTLSRFGPGEF